MQHMLVHIYILCRVRLRHIRSR